MASLELPADPTGSNAGVALPERISHYEVLGALGRGGMACVYHVRDTRNGRSVALKQLLPQRTDQHTRESALLFEREFRTLAQLSHPRVIEVYDYGVGTDGTYYTMELLDGGDLRERSPLGWQQACELIFDVCSSLALLHSRRLVHRDVSPRNVRCTRDGHAKLIDFGAMVAMGSTAQVVGTPAFVAPEAMSGATLDARTDLFSLGATLYFALTGRLAYPARSFAHLVESWSSKPPAPSVIAPDVPPRLDQLVMSLISLEAALRPRSAFEVMQRLAAVAGIAREEPLSVSQAYLVTPLLVARDELLVQFRELLVRASQGRGRGVLIAAPAGFGRTRVLEACALEAKMRGYAVLRASASHELGVPHALAEQLLQVAPAHALEAARAAGVWQTLFEPEPELTSARDTLPRLRSFARSGVERSALGRALSSWFLAASKQTPLLIAVDDVERLEDTSLGLLVGLAQRARVHGLLLLATALQSADGSLPVGLEALHSRCSVLPLRALQLAETEQLLGSVFGDVPNLALLAARIHALAAGYPREVMGVAQHLIDRETIRYEAGSWSLPERLTAADMPASAQQVFELRAARLSPLARRLAEAQALAQEPAFNRDDYALLEPLASSAELDAALSELVAQQVLAIEGSSTRLDNRALLPVLCDALDDATRRARYHALAERSARAGRSAFATARLFLLCGESARGLDLLLGFVRSLRDRIEFMDASGVSIDEGGRTLLLGLSAALELDRSKRELADLRHWITLLSVAADDSLYWAAAPAWRAQLEHDSGLHEYWALADVTDSGQRLTRALQSAATRHAAAPERERVYPADQAIRLLVHYVVLSIAVGTRTYDSKLVLSLPALLEPFAPLSPLVAAIWQNAIASREVSCYRRTERASQIWIELYERVGKISSPDPQILSGIRYGIAYGVGLNEATLGIEAATRWADILDNEPLQRVSAMYLRKVVRLQQGDLDGAERCRKQAELLALQSNVRQVFTSLLSLELAVHAAAWDLTGVKQLAARIQPHAERNPGWLPFRYLAEGHYRRLLGDLPAAEQAYRRCFALAVPDPADPERSIAGWPSAVASLSEVLIALDRAGEARELATAALRELDRLEVRASSFDVVRALGLAEAKLGDHAQAAARLEQLIEQQRALGVSGLSLGASYEARTRVAIWAGAQSAVEHFAKLTAEQYRHGCGSTLGARYERLMEEARGAGVLVLPPLSPYETAIFGASEIGTRTTASSRVASALAGARDSLERAQRALQLLCEACGVLGGHLYLGAEHALRLAASSSGQPPDDMLQRLVSDYWSQQADDTDPDTEMLSEAAPASPIWTDGSGTSYRPLLLHGTHQGAHVTAGVALLAGAAAHAAPEAALLSEVANFLLRTGDSVPSTGV